MALTDDQRAMLQLLLQQGQSYADIASLLGLDIDQVRARARAAMTELAGEDPDRTVSLTDYLLGQADPIGRADAARQIQSDGGVRDLAERLVTQLRLLAPGAELPELPPADTRTARRTTQPPVPEAPVEAGAAPPVRRPLGEFASTLSPRQRQTIAGLLGGGILVVIVVLIATGAFSGGGGSSSSSNEKQSSSQAASNNSGLTRAVLSPQDGGKAEGVAVFARVRNTPVLQVNISNLAPSPKRKAYVIWLYGGRSQAFPLVRQAVGRSGQLRGAAPVPAQLIQALQQGIFDSIDVSLASDSQITAALRQARKSQQLPRYAGRSAVRGKIVGPGFTSAGGSSSG